ncbi:MAG: helix-turn-helix domain-containing protein, partial [Bacteroidota bacterium]
RIADFSFFSYEVTEALHLSDAEKTTITDLVRKIEQEYDQNIDTHSQNLIIANIDLLLGYCTRYYDRQFYTRTNLNQDHVTRFERFLKEYYDKGLQMELGVPSVAYCGAELNMSAHYLSDLLRKETGRNAQQHIHDAIVERAKNMLLGTRAPLGQIAYDLGFEYPQHFSKVFKKKTGVSPSTYRKLN